MDSSNCLGIRSFADFYSCKDLFREADEYVRKNFVLVVTSDEFLPYSFYFKIL